MGVKLILWYTEIAFVQWLFPSWRTRDRRAAPLIA
jgi:hypothetical protein